MGCCHILSRVCSVCSKFEIVYVVSERLYRKENIEVLQVPGSQFILNLRTTLNQRSEISCVNKSLQKQTSFVFFLSD